MTTEHTTRLPPRSKWPLWMQAAALELGVREKPGKESNPRIEEYFACTRADERALNDDNAWCAAFACFCLQQSGYKNPRYAMARNFVKYGDEVPPAEVQFGDILVFKRGSDARLAHVCFYVRDIGADFEVLGGNSLNSVRYGHESKADLLDHGVRRPVML